MQPRFHAQVVARRWFPRKRGVPIPISRPEQTTRRTSQLLFVRERILCDSPRLFLLARKRTSTPVDSASRLTVHTRNPHEWISHGSVIESSCKESNKLRHAVIIHFLAGSGKEFHLFCFFHLDMLAAVSKKSPRHPSQEQKDLLSKKVYTSFTNLTYLRPREFVKVRTSSTSPSTKKHIFCMLRVARLAHRV